MLPAGSIVIVHLAEPQEKLWGVLEGLDAAGVLLRGIHISSLESWILQAVRGAERRVDLATQFLPMRRIERIFLDEQVGEVESYRQQFERRVGRTVESYLDRAGR